MAYAKKSKQALQEKLGYELWLLSYLLKQTDYLRGEATGPTIRFPAGDPPEVMVFVSEVIGGAAALDVISSVRILVFVACFKILDVVFEWIINENLGVNDRKFVEKERILKQGKLRFPGRLKKRKFIIQYFRAMYLILIEYRHEIVHRHGGNASLDGSMTISITSQKRAGQLPALTLTSTQVESLSRTVVVFAKLALGEIEPDPTTALKLKFYFDGIGATHLQRRFDIKAPVRARVIVEGSMAPGGLFVDLGRIRRMLAFSWSEWTIVYALEVYVVDGGAKVRWVIPMAKLPRGDTLLLTAESFPEYRVDTTD